MPLYEYRCAECHEVCEVLQKVNAKPLEKCPKCGGGPMIKRISSPAIQFKGNGWYITDYAKKTAAPAGPSGETKTAGPGPKAKSKPAAGQAAASTAGKSSS